jgi:hypothetical protein
LDGNEGAYRPNWFFISPDECHKANFVPYLRATLANGGFRGKIESEGENRWKVEPGLELTRTLAVGLTPM